MLQAHLPPFAHLRQGQSERRKQRSLRVGQEQDARKGSEDRLRFGARRAEGVPRRHARAEGGKARRQVRLRFQGRERGGGKGKGRACRIARGGCRRGQGAHLRGGGRFVVFGGQRGQARGRRLRGEPEREYAEIHRPFLCHRGADFDKQKKDDNIQINIQELAEQIIQSRSFEDELNMVDKDITMSDYDFTQDEIKNLISYQSTGATSEELVILQVNDKSKLNDVKEKINTRLEERKEAFESYLPEEVFKIDNNILEVKNDYIIMCISNDSNKVNEVINNYIKK